MLGAPHPSVRTRVLRNIEKQLRRLCFRRRRNALFCLQLAALCAILYASVVRDGEWFDYSVYLVERSRGTELEITKESPKSETAYGETLATVSKGGLSIANVTQEGQNVNRHNIPCPILKANNSLKASRYISRIPRCVMQTAI